MDPSLVENAVPAQPWSLWVGRLGSGAVLAALALNLLAALLWLGARRWPVLSRWGKVAFASGACGFLVSIGAVVTLFLNNQFEYRYVFNHGSLDTEARYKVAGAWAGQEGSILLWATMSALFGVLAAPFTGKNRRWFTTVYALFLASVAAILAYESPFALRPFVGGQALVPPDGAGLHPSLMNYWVVIHPPTIFAGFGSLTVLFAWSMAAMLGGDLDDWIKSVRPWALVSLTLLGLGLAMGGFWAYETLGWGGFWMWDPVENTSFVPWVAVAAFLHGLFVQVSRGKWRLTNLFLAGLPFLLFSYGTFLTRSGYLGDTSVHSFAEMNRSALWILISIAVVGALAFCSVWTRTWLQSGKAAVPQRDMKPWPINRELLMGLAVWLLAGFGLVTAIGMSVPFLDSLAGRKPKVVEEPLYNTVLSFLFLPLMVFMAIGPFVTWKGMGLRALVSRFVNVFWIDIGLIGCFLLWIKSDVMGIPADLGAKARLLLAFDVPRHGWVMVLTFFCLFAIIASAWKLLENLRRSPSGVGGMVTHLGLAVAMLGLVFSRGMEQKRDAFVITSTRPTEALGYQFKALGATGSFVDHNNKIEVEVQKAGLNGPTGPKFTLKPGLYYRGTDAEGNPVPFIWPAIAGQGAFDLYLVLHDLVREVSDPAEFQVGLERPFPAEGMVITYKGLETNGRFGQPGAEFRARVTVRQGDQSYDVAPALRVGQSGLEKLAAPVGAEFEVGLVRIDPATKAATLQILYAKPAYVAELFYKPLTLLVWLGVGIMSVGGGLTAWTRRVRPAVAPEPKAGGQEPATVEEPSDILHAAEPAPQG